MSVQSRLSLWAVCVPLAICAAQSRAWAALPSIAYTTAIVADQNATAMMTQLPLSTLGLAPYVTAQGSPPTALRFTSAGAYKLVAQFLVQSDVAVDWSFGVQLDLATPGTYSLPTVTQALSFAAGTYPTTYVATMVIDALYVSQNDAVSFAASVRPHVPGQSYTIQPKILRGLAGTTLNLLALQ